MVLQVLQHTSLENPYFGVEQNCCCTCQCKDFPPNYAVIPSFISCFTTFYHLHPNLINILVYIYIYRNPRKTPKTGAKKL